MSDEDQNGMAKRPALALLVASSVPSLANMLVIRSVTGTKKTIISVVLAVLIGTFSGISYGSLLVNVMRKECCHVELL